MQSINIPTFDISRDADRQVVIAAGTETTYQGHPTTVLLPDGRTVLCVWSINHGGPCGPMARSADGGRTWTSVATPSNWADVRNCPAIYRLVDPRGRARLVVFAGQGGADDAMHLAWSEDDGHAWTPMRSTGLHVVMPFCSVTAIDGGAALLGMTSIRRPGETVEERSNVLASSLSTDGGLIWSPLRVILDMPGNKPCEPWVLRAPDGRQLLCLIRENNRALCGWKMTSEDEGRTWSPPAQLPAALSGDRHVARGMPDGRIVAVYRDTAPDSPSAGHFVAWVGTYDDIIAGREGQYRVKLLHHQSTGWPDCGYPGLEALPDGTLLATTYLKYRPGPEQHSVVCTCFRLEEFDR